MAEAVPYGTMYRLGYEDAVTDIRDSGISQWISVTDRLPVDEEAKYLVASDHGYGMTVHICSFAENLAAVDYDLCGMEHSGFYDYDSEYGYFEKRGVLYWMPVPEPPSISYT